MAAIGPGTPSTGEMKMKGLWHSTMIAKTIFKLLGREYPKNKAGQTIESMLKQANKKYSPHNLKSQDITKGKPAI